MDSSPGQSTTPTLQPPYQTTSGLSDQVQPTNQSPIVIIKEKESLPDDITRDKVTHADEVTSHNLEATGNIFSLIFIIVIIIVLIFYL